MADRQQVHAQLVRATGDRRQFKARPAPGRIVRQHAPACQRRLAMHPVDLLTRPVRPVGGQRQVDLAAVADAGADPSANQRHVALVDLPQLEQPAEADAARRLRAQTAARPRSPCRDGARSGLRASCAWTCWTQLPAASTPRPGTEGWPAGLQTTMQAASRCSSCSVGMDQPSDRDWLSSRQRGLGEGPKSAMLGAPLPAASCVMHATQDDRTIATHSTLPPHLQGPLAGGCHEHRPAVVDAGGAADRCRAGRNHPARIARHRADPGRHRAGGVDRRLRQGRRRHADRDHAAGGDCLGA